jgi:hypothetical protein
MAPFFTPIRELLFVSDKSRTRPECCWENRWNDFPKSLRVSSACPSGEESGQGQNPTKTQAKGVAIFHSFLADLGAVLF